MKFIVVNVAAAIVAIHNPLCIMAFSRSTTLYFHHAQRRLHATNSKLWSAAAAANATSVNPIDVPITSNNKNCNALFHPLGPPSFLSKLTNGEVFHSSSLNKNITRLSTMPDIFLVRDLISKDDGEILMNAATFQGMKIAGTRQSGDNTIRKKSSLVWIDPYSFESGKSAASTIARGTIAKSRLCFSHEAMNDLMDNNVDTRSDEYALAEDMQVAQYDAGGRYDYHHDGYGRYLTVLAYLNGVGGTYFPHGKMGSSQLDGIDFTNENEESDTAIKKVGKCGILIVGKEGADAYLNSTFVKPKDIIEIQAGDAIAFYNYGSNGDKDLQSAHCSLTVPEEKWIATCWFRSEALTGPYSSMKRDRLLEEW
eukprot:CAMPEP_0201922906 /NCGR_PEP_ID=MMETSP0903-20130614/10804_1 /ASSEMBLY_ACC=CAM_ASM_000552 /TAXON_ID=420261 /ORGANISM="Thalassiosira antarctica, Strain CCMP982" /LENGTH=366 /DNA_ID=CAMNT_0048460117 /DNA_START=269 /DNA_END=1366 /DNA_ORIENTATION=-